MQPLGSLHKHRLRLGLLAALLATLVAGLFAVARGQEQLPTNCTVIARIRICADEIKNGPLTFTATGRLITLGREDQPQTVRVLAPTLDEGPGELASVFVDLSGVPLQGNVSGDLSLLGDFQGKPMVRTNGEKALRAADGVLLLDFEGARITNFPSKFPQEP
ncbi:MAG: hypothetical protein H7Y32_16525, partial [Chloroflexales bacterium]|nr:hypothetical protein [Chloroflexales bacterium]